MIDLHCHSYFSDGQLSPEHLVEKAHGNGVRCLALTDHDTTEGLLRFSAAARSHGICPVNGVEISVRWKKYDIHLLGLGIDPQHDGLAAMLRMQGVRRKTRAEAIGEALLASGLTEAYAKASELAGHDRPGRPHFALALLREGLVRDLQGAFRRWLARGKPAYVPVDWPELVEAIPMVLASGGSPVLAHPLKYQMTRTRLHALLQDFRDAGGVGMEVVSGLMQASETMELAGLCARFGLLASSGSDFHADGFSRVPPGMQRQLPVHCSPIWHQWNWSEGTV